MSHVADSTITADTLPGRHQLASSFVQQTLAEPTRATTSAATRSPAELANEQLQRSLKGVAVATSLKRWTQSPVSLFEAESGESIYFPPDRAPLNWGAWCELIRAAGRSSKPQVIEDEDPLLIQALPVTMPDGTRAVATMAYVTRHVTSVSDVTRAATALGAKPEDLFAWALHQTVCHPQTIERVGELIVAKLLSDKRVHQLESENEQLSTHIAATFEEISLIYRLTHSLKLSSNREDLARQALGWLTSAVHAETLLISFLPDAAEQSHGPLANAANSHVSLGPARLNETELAQIVEKMQLGPHSHPLVINRPVTGRADWQWPAIQELVVAPIAEGDHLFGWLAAVNTTRDQEFTTVEANLLASVGAILGIHSANLNLYKLQSGMLADVVRAMVSAIDAKDPYTRGHSDRVARVAARLARELGLGPDTVKTIYLAGLLHDIGKIGIDDNVLRKPGKLTDAEFEHVKRHVEIGYRILRDLKQMQPMLPVVLHHHESWDGTGYPHKLAGNDIPFLARIAAVADAYDAMASDRPYRPGMADEKLDHIIRTGAGQQWDPDVVAAFFRARDDIREISRREATADELQALQFT